MKLRSIILTLIIGSSCFINGWKTALGSDMRPGESEEDYYLRLLREELQREEELRRMEEGKKKVKKKDKKGDKVKVPWFGLPDEETGSKKGKKYKEFRGYKLIEEEGNSSDSQGSVDKNALKSFKIDDVNSKEPTSADKKSDKSKKKDTEENVPLTTKPVPQR